jgi:hypothetical protein
MKLASKLFASFLALAVAGPVLAADKPAEKKPDAAAGAEKPKAKAGLRGTVVKVDGDKLTIKAGKDGKETVVTTSKETKVKIEGKDATLADLKEGQMVNVSPAEGTALTVSVAPAAKPKK